VPRIRRFQPSVVHAHFGWAAPLAAELADRLGLPLVCTFHATDVTVTPEPPAFEGGVSPTYAGVFRRLDHAFAVSQYIADALQAIGWRGPTEILPAGVRLDLFPERSRIPPADPARLLYAGRLVRRKGLDVLLHAFGELQTQRPDITLEVVGDGEERAEYEELARTVAPGGNVRFLGACGRDDVLRALQSAHVLILPSRTMPSGEVEGSPVIVKEALAVGVPVVATRNGGLPEVIPPAYRDELVPEDDPAALATRLEAILQDAPAWPDRARVGRAWVEAEFDWGVLGRRTAEVYARLAASNPRG
jgi:glycosyltransferase involved in cell wall biosynthesis